MRRRGFNEGAWPEGKGAEPALSWTEPLWEENGGGRRRKETPEMGLGGHKEPRNGARGAQRTPKWVWGLHRNHRDAAGGTKGF